VRIVHVADSFLPDVGGIERQVEALARRQVLDGHDVTVITAVAEPAQLDLDVVRALNGRWLTVAFPWRNYRRVAEILDARPVDVVHAHFSVVSPLAVYVSRTASRRGIPVAATVHSLWWTVPAATKLTSVPFGWGRIRAAWSGVSTVAAARVQRTLPRVGPISVVPNLVDTAWWQAAEPGTVTSGEDLRLVLAGRLKKRKHVNEFIDVLAKVRKRLPPGLTVQVSIVGDGPRRTDLQQQIQRLGLADWIRLLGHQEPVELRALLHASDLFIAPSRQESFGIAALEARAAGLPVLGYLNNGLADFITDGTDGVLVQDAAGMADALTGLFSDPENLKRLGKTAQSLAPSVRPDQAISTVYELYRRAQVMHPEHAQGETETLPSRRESV
jgi:glycosyltransferase involved in cell wall biosynthesis